MIGPIERFMTEEHAAIDALLETDFEAFRERLLRHIGMEEKVLLPYAREKRGGESLPIARQLRLDHGQIAKLLVPSPTSEGREALRLVLGRHNALEEGEGGLYSVCDALAGLEAESLVEKMKAQPRVPVARHYDGPLLSVKR